MAYIRISEDLDNDSRKEAEELDIVQDQALERRFYGCDEHKEIASEAKEVLEKYVASESERYKTIENYWKSFTQSKFDTPIVKSCYDILKEDMEK